MQGCLDLFLVETPSMLSLLNIFRVPQPLHYSYEDLKSFVRGGPTQLFLLIRTKYEPFFSYGVSLVIYTHVSYERNFA